MVYTVILNGIMFKVGGGRLSYTQIVAMVNGEPEAVYSIVCGYRNNKAAHSIRPGQTVDLVDGMHIICMVTNGA